MKIKKEEDFSIKSFIKKHKKVLSITGVIAALLIISFMIVMMCPINIWQSNGTGIDSSVFKTIAYMMKNGFMPYRDVFDHKGPIIYILNLIGINIAYYRGIWVVEFISMFITVFFMYKIARLNCNKVLSIITVLISSTMLFTYFEGGNLVEEYAMPFIAISLYIFLDYFLNKKISKLRLMACGFSCAIILLLRPNMVSTWVVFSIAVLVYNIQKRTIKDLGKFIIYFLIGFAIPIVPTIIWLTLNNSLSAFIDDYILFNMLYSSQKGGRAIFSTRAESFLYFFNETIMLLAVLSNVYSLYSRKEKFVNITYIIYLFVTLLFICVSGRTSGHYGMILVPAVAFPISQLIGLLEDGLKKNISAPSVFMLLYLLVTLILPRWINMLNTINLAYENRNKIDNSYSYYVVSDYILNNTDEDDKITVYGNWDIIHVLTKRMPASKYIYQDPIGFINPKIMEEYIKDLENEKPKMIIVNAYMVELLRNYIDNNNYELVFDDDPVKIYELRTNNT